MMIGHPDCTYLSRAGIGFIINNPERQEKCRQAAIFFNKLLHASIHRIAIENPIQHRFAREYIRKYDQIINPFMFGESEWKKTCLWLVNLPLLNPSVALWNIPQPIFTDYTGTKRFFTDHFAPSKDRKLNRSRTFISIAAAMAEQWNYLI